MTFVSHNVPTFGWDRQNLFALLCPKVTHNNGREQQLSLDVITSHPAVGCHTDFELVALQQVIDYHQEYFRDAEPESIKVLSQSYRAAMQQCLQQWVSSLSLSSNDKDTTTADWVSLETLKSMYSVMHLADVFFPLLLSRTTTSSWNDEHCDLFNVPGMATAGMVRFLRYNLMGHVDLKRDPTMVEMLNSVYPEQFEKDGENFYWALLESEVLRGCLDNAWTILSQHSLYQQALHAVNEDDYIGMTLAEVRESFDLLRDILLRAPLPGGRTDDFDDAVGDIEWEEEEDIAYGDFTDSIDVQPTDYKDWESIASAELMMENAGFESRAARKHKEWKEYTKRKLRNFSLAQRHIPALKPMLAILCGDLSNVAFASWPGKLLAELLYVTPDIRPRNVTSRVKRMLATGVPSPMDADKTDSILAIMNGNMGEAMELMYAFGGGSGAALPSTMTALLYCLFAKAHILPEDLADRKSEFLCEAAFSIVSSLAKDNLGTVLAVKLLAPYAIHNGNAEILAAIATLMEHHAPSSDAGADELLELCYPLVERKGMQILDACSSIILCRFRSHITYERVPDAIKWLSKGVDLEGSLLPLLELGSCYRRLAAECLRIAHSLLGNLATCEDMEETVEMSLEFDRANVFTMELRNRSFTIPEANILQCVVALYSAAIRKQSPDDQLARSIISCLESTDRSGTQNSTTNCAGFHRRLLKVVHRMLLFQGNLYSYQSVPAMNASSFGGFGILTLMERLMQIAADPALRGSDEYPTEQETSDLKRLLTEARCRAFIEENAEKAEALIDPWSSKVNMTRSCQIETLTSAEKEELCDNLLSF